MHYLRKHWVTVWYRYPSDEVPRELRVRIASAHWSIADAVSLQIGRDHELEDVLASTRPTEALRPHLRTHPELEYALRWACIRPPPYVAPAMTRRKRAGSPVASPPDPKRTRSR